MKPALKIFGEGGEGPDWAGFLDRGARIEGALDVPGTFRLDGALKGRISSRNALVLGETAEVEGEIEGERVLIYGRFRGTLRASVQIEIHAGALVAGHLFTPCLVLEPGGRFDGDCYLNQAGTESDPVRVPIRPSPLGESRGD
jgi:cytoskeletal protein CcmA (bactofilin family)